jgi:hypothetical protein
MNREDIIRMAREANFYDSEIGNAEDSFVHFAALVAAAEREACAKLCDVTIPGDECATALINSYADDIRARGEKK